jgi:hypothetical protein
MTRHGGRQMRWFGTLVYGLCAYSGLALAAAPVVDPQALGITEAIVNYCAPINASATARLQEKLRQLEQGASEEALNKVRNTSAYRAAYKSINDVVSKVPAQNAPGVCSESPPASK